MSRVVTSLFSRLAALCAHRAFVPAVLALATALTLPAATLDLSADDLIQKLRLAPTPSTLAGFDPGPAW